MREFIKIISDLKKIQLTVFEVQNASFLKNILNIRKDADTSVLRIM